MVWALILTAMERRRKGAKQLKVKKKKERKNAKGYMGQIQYVTFDNNSIELLDAFRCIILHPFNTNISLLLHIKFCNLSHDFIRKSCN